VFAIGLVGVVVAYGLAIFVALLVPYWVIRLAVRHGIEDAWQRRSKREAQQTPVPGDWPS